MCLIDRRFVVVFHLLCGASRKVQKVQTIIALVGPNDTGAFGGDGERPKTIWASSLVAGQRPKEMYIRSSK